MTGRVIEYHAYNLEKSISYRCQFDWPQANLTTAGLAYSGHHFFEIFVDEPLRTYIRGEGPSVQEAEKEAWATYQKYLACPHTTWDRKDRNDGWAWCAECGMFSSERVEIIPHVLQATLRPGYVLPQKDPAVCPECDVDYSPLAYCDEESISLSGFSCACEGVEDDEMEHEWPFVEEAASIADFEAIGFWVVNV